MMNLTTDQSRTMNFRILIETNLGIVDLGSKMRILMVEDEEVTAAMLCGTLTAMGHQVTVATDGLAAWKLLQKEHFPVILSDWMMPGLDGPTLCRRIRAQGDSRYTYIIMVSARDQRTDRMEGLRAGADDFLIKPYEAEELAVRLEVANRILSIQEQLERQNARLTELATTDDLTGLANRREFRRAIEANFALARGQGPSLSLILLDIDHFKDFNDTFGHPAGDDALRTLAQVLRSSCREHELAARFGGEEFAVVLLGASREEARGTAQRIRAALGESQWPHRPLTSSFGIATSGPEGSGIAAGIAELVEQADAALYSSKKQGRDRITHHDDRPDSPSPVQEPGGRFLGSVAS
jgi:diguanylate cyclase (GGDEF)-like protein